MPELVDILFRKIDERLNLAALFKILRETRPKGYISPLDAPPISPGRIALILVILLILSGLGLTLYYHPTAERAASSLAYLHKEQPLGWLIHNTHRWSALLLFVFVILHALRVWLTGAYRFPRDINWWWGIFAASSNLTGWLRIPVTLGYQSIYPHGPDHQQFFQCPCCRTTTGNRHTRWNRIGCGAVVPRLCASRLVSPVCVDLVGHRPSSGCMEAGAG